MLLDSKNRVIQFINSKSLSYAETDKNTRGFLWPVLTTCFVVFLAFSGSISHSFDPEKKPVEAVEFLQQNHIPGHMFNEDEFGDYLIYAAYPEYRVFFDGRNDMYGVEHMKEYHKVTRLETGWENVLQKYKIQWILYNADSLLSRYLLERKDWHLIYADKVAHIYLKNIPEYEQFINKYKNVQPVHDAYY